MTTETQPQPTQPTPPSRPSLATQPTTPGTPEREPAQRHTPNVLSSDAPWALVAAREIVVRVTNRTFLLSTLVTLVLISGFAAWQVVQSKATTTHTVAVSGPDGGRLVAAANTAAHADDATVTIAARQVGTDAAARAALMNGEAAVWLHPGTDGWHLTSTDEANSTLTNALEAAVRTEALTTNAADAGTSLAALERGTELTVDRLDGKVDNTGPIKAGTFAFALLFYMAAMVFGLQIAGSVVEEKQSRLVEIIATAIPLRQLLAGKVLGNAVLALAQVALYCVVGLVAISFTDWSIALPGIVAAVGWFVVFFAVGFFALACLYAVAGALASRNEDLQSTTAPMTMVLMAIYFASFGLSGTAERVASFVPIVSVVSMPGRILSGQTAWWEPVAALVIMAAFAVLTVLVGERVYRRSLMQTRGKMTWRQALAAEE